MAGLSYVQLPKPVYGAELLQQTLSLKELRLLSLKTDASCFLSRYEDEVDRPIEFSLKRVQDPQARHFVAMMPPEAPEKTVYDAFFVLIERDQDESKTAKEYEMAAVYVRPSHREKGVFSRLFQIAMQWVNEDFRQHNYKEALVHTTVVEGNAQAERLYKKLGFELVRHTTHKNKIGLDIPGVQMQYRIF